MTGRGESAVISQNGNMPVSLLCNITASITQTHSRDKEGNKNTDGKLEYYDRRQERLVMIFVQSVQSITGGIRKIFGSKELINNVELNYFIARITKCSEAKLNFCNFHLLRQMASNLYERLCPRRGEV